MKKILILLLSLMLMISLISCGGEEEPPQVLPDPVPPATEEQKPGDTEPDAPHFEEQEDKDGGEYGELIPLNPKG